MVELKVGPIGVAPAESLKPWQVMPTVSTVVKTAVEPPVREVAVMASRGISKEEEEGMLRMSF